MAEGMSEREQLLELEALVRDNQLDRAVELGKELSDAYPDSFQVQFTYAGVLRRLNEPERAREILQGLLKRYPENINLLLALAEIARIRRDPDAAREHYNRILFLDPFNPAAREALAALGGGPAKATPSHRDVTPRRVELDPERDEAGAGFEINLDDVQPDESPTLDLDEAGVPRPQIEVEDTGPPIPEFGLPLEDTTASGRDEFPAPRAVAPEAAPEPSASRPDREKPALRVTHPDIPAAPEPDMTDTARLRLETEDEAQASSAAPAAEGVEFFTESAANLYAAQGLWSEAADIYRELHRRDPDPRFLERAREMERRRLSQVKIERLKRLLDGIQSGNQGEADV
jgi:tetratricopeptide (TPR) repeat protein